MKRIILYAIFIITIIQSVLLVPSALGDADDAKKEIKTEAKKEGPSVSRDTNGDVVIEIGSDIQKQTGIKIETLVATQFAPELKAYGRVLDPTPLAALINELAIDQAAASASSNEMARLRTLSTSGNATARALQTAEATALHDQLLTESVRDRLGLSWGREIINQADLPAFIRSLTTLETILLRVDLAGGERLNSSPLAARVVSLSGDSAEARVFGVAPSMDPLTQGRGFIMEVKTNETRFLPGEAVTAYLKMPGDPLNGVTIPRSAIIRTEGRAWVYVGADADHFTRKEIVLDHPTDNGWFITNGLPVDAQIVVTGAQALLSEETKPSGPPE